MAYDLEWDHYFCLTCDKQTLGDAYCSESCRMIDYEQAACNIPIPSSPCYPPEGTISYLWKDAHPSRYDRQVFNAPGQTYGHYYYPPQYNNLPPSYAPSQRHAVAGGYRNASVSAALPTQAAPTSSSTAAANPMASMLGRGGATTSVTYAHALSPSSSHSSLSSMQSGLSGGARGSGFSGGALDALSAFAYGSMRSNHGTRATTTGNSRLDQARSELRKYANSLEQGKLQRDLQRRRSC